MDCAVVVKHNKKKKHKRKKDDEDGNLYTSTELGVDSDVSKKQNNEKDLSDNHLVVKKKKKKKLVEHDIEENTTSADTSLVAIQVPEENTKNKKRKKKQKENECETLHTVDVIPEVSKKYKKRKHMLQSDELEGVRNVLECEDGINILEPPTKKKKKKKKHIDKSEIKEEVLLPVKEIDTVELKGDQLLQSNGHIKATERILTKIDTLIEDNVKRKKHKSNNKENKSKNMDISPYLHKKRKHNLENEEQYSERTDATVISKTKKKKKKSERKENNCDLTKLEPEDEASSSLPVAPENKKSSEIGAQKRQKSTSKHKKETKRDFPKLKDIFSLSDLDSDENEDTLNEEVACLEEQAQSIKDKNRLSCEEEKKLSDLRIMVPWPVSPLHMIETRITMRPNQRQAEKIKELGVEVKSAQYYSKAEDEQLTKNWHKFCKLHDLPQDPKPFHNMVNPDGQNIVSVPERLNFVRFLAHNLNDRLLCSVYKRFRRLCPAQQLKTGSRFTTEEDQLIMKYIKKSSSRTPYSDLGALLGRNKFAVEKRARILVEEANYGNLDVKWNTERIEEFVKHVVDVTKVANVNELQNRQIEQKEWRQLEKKLNIPVRKLQKGWACRIFPTLFAKDHSSTMQVKRSLVKILLERGENDFKTVDWTLIQKELGKDADGFTGRGLHELLQGMIYHIVPPKMRNDPKACLEYLNRAFENGEIRGRRLKKFTPMATEA